MTTKAFDAIKAGLDDALAYAEGDASKGSTHALQVEDIDVASIRKASGLSRQKFADRFGLDVRALQDWEQGRRRPDRAARAYLTVIARDPEAVQRALAG